MRSLDPTVLTLTGAAEQRVAIGAGGTIEVRFSGRARAIGQARVQMTARVGDETDAFQDVIPVEILASPETVAAYGTAAGTATTRARDGHHSAGGRAWLRRARSRAVVHGAGRPRRRRALPRRVSLRLRRAEGLDVAGAVPGRRSRRRVFAAGHEPGRDEDGVAEDAEGTRTLPVRERRLRLLAGRLRHGVAVSHRLRAARDEGGRGPRLPRRCRRAQPRLRLPLERAGRHAAGRERGMVAVLHRLAGLRREGAGRRRPQRRLARDAPLRLPRSHAGVRAGLPARCGARQGRDQRRPRDRPAPAHDQRHPARGRQRPRGRAVGPVPAVVLELERALDGDRAALAGAGGCERGAVGAAGALADDGAHQRALGQHPGERARDGGAGGLLPQVRADGA